MGVIPRSARRVGGGHRSASGLVTVVFAAALLATSCTFSSTDRAQELANATPTTPPTVEPTALPTSAAADPVASEDNPDPTVAPQPGWIVIQNVDRRLNVRSGAGTEFGVVGQADLGSVLATTGEQQDVGDAVWLEVVFDDGLGWVHGGFVVATSEPTPTPLSTPTPLATPTPQLSDDSLLVDAPLGLNLRSEPDADAAIIRKLDDGDVVTATGAQSEDGDGTTWVEIIDGDTTGWVSQEFVKAP